MPINTNPTGLFPEAQLGSDSPYTYLADGQSITSSGGGIYIPLVDLDDYIPSANVLDEAHVDADYRYLILALNEAVMDHHGGLANADKHKNTTLTEGNFQSSKDGKLSKVFTQKFFYDTASLTLKSGDE